MLSSLLTFQTEYVALVQQCMNFACELMDLCRGTQEVEAVLGVENDVSCEPLARLRLAIQYDEKKARYTRYSFTARRCASALRAMILYRHKVCLSVTSRSSIKTARYTIMQRKSMTGRRRALEVMCAPIASLFKRDFSYSCAAAVELT